MNPLRKRLGIEAKGKVCSPDLIERACFTATRALSYEATEQIAQCWGVDIADSTIQRHVCEQGARIEKLRARQVAEAVETGTRQRVVKRAAREFKGQEFSLVIMPDGWMIRQRGAKWGHKPAEAEAERVEWREIKTGIVFRVEDQASTQSGRGLLINKRYEAWQGDPDTFGQRMFALALRNGLYQARRVYVVADGAVWIWNLAQQRFTKAIEQLDFYHASEHLWAVAHALYEDDGQAQAWVEPLLSQLRHGAQNNVVQTLGEAAQALGELNEANRKIVETNAAYFERNKHRLDYATNTAHGCPAGSGAIESTCAQMQDRFKRTGQFWTRPGAAQLMTLEIIRRNKEWEEYWGQMVA